MEKYFKQFIAPAIAVTFLVLITNVVFADNTNNTVITTGDSCSYTQVQTWVNSNSNIPLDWNVPGQHPDCNPSPTLTTSPTCTKTPTPTPSCTPSVSPSIAPTTSPSPSSIPATTTTPTQSVTPTPTGTSTLTPTPTGTSTLTPTPTGSSNNGGNGGGSGGGGGSSSASSCSDPAPLGTPTLYQVNVNGNSATIYFVPVSGSAGYYIGYGTNSNADSFGIQFTNSQTSGAVEYTINNLYPGTWYFKVRGQNGCMPGSWSNTMNSNGSMSSNVLGASTGPQVLGLSYTSGDNTLPFALQSIIALICGSIGIKFLRKSY